MLIFGAYCTNYLFFFLISDLRLTVLLCVVHYCCCLLLA